MHSGQIEANDFKMDLLAAHPWMSQTQTVVCLRGIQKALLDMKRTLPKDKNVNWQEEKKT